MTFLGCLLSLLAKLGLDFWTHRGPSAIVVEAEEAGTAEADLATARQDAAVSKAVAQAEIDAPSTQAGVVDALNKGVF